MICFPSPHTVQVNLIRWQSISTLESASQVCAFLFFFSDFDFSLLCRFGSSSLSFTSQTGCVAFISRCFSCHGPLSFWFLTGKRTQTYFWLILFQSLLFPLLYILKIGQIILSVPPTHTRTHVQDSYVCFNLNKHCLLCLWATASFESGHGFWYAVCKRTTGQN